MNVDESDVCFDEISQVSLENNLAISLKTGRQERFF